MYVVKLDFYTSFQDKSHKLKKIVLNLTKSQFANCWQAHGETLGDAEL